MSELSESGAKIYADMLEYRYQMYEGVPMAHLWYYDALERLRKVLLLLPDKDRHLIFGE